MHPPLQLLLPVTLLMLAAPASAKLDFTKDILPLLESRCFKCHRAEHEENGRRLKPKGDIRLDAAWALLRGNKDVIPVRPKEPAKSAIITVTTLPKDDDKFMPPQGKADPLSPQEIIKLKTWIIEGADFGGWQGNLAGKPSDPPAVVTRPAREREHDLLHKKLAEGLAPPSAASLKAVQAAGAQITPLMPDSPLLRVDFLTGTSRCDDRSITALAPVQNNIVQLDLARTAITDAALKSVAQMPRLIRLDLRRTKITDAGLPALAPLKHLHTLNLHGTAITDTGLASLASLKNLTSITLYESKVTDEGVARLKQALPKADIILNNDIAAAAALPQPDSKKKKKP